METITTKELAKRAIISNIEPANTLLIKSSNLTVREYNRLSVDSINLVITGTAPEQTLSTIQDIHITATPQFANVKLTNLTSNQFIFPDSNNFLTTYSNSNKLLAIGDATWIADNLILLTGANTVSIGKLTNAYIGNLGTENYIAKFGATGLSNSLIQDDGTRIGYGGAPDAVFNHRFYNDVWYTGINNSYGDAGTGLLTIGKSLSDYSTIAYNCVFQSSGLNWKYRVTDKATAIRFGGSGAHFQFLCAPSGTAGSDIVWTLAFSVNTNVYTVDLPRQETTFTSLSAKMSIGNSGGNVGGIAYNTAFQSDGTYKYRASTVSAFLQIGGVTKRFSFLYAPSGSAGGVITWIEACYITSAGLFYINQGLTATGTITLTGLAGTGNRLTIAGATGILSAYTNSSKLLTIGDTTWSADNLILLTGTNTISIGKLTNAYIGNLGTERYFPLFGATGFTDSVIYQTATNNIGINTTTPATTLQVNGQSLWLTNGDGGTLSTTEKGLRLYFDHANDRAGIFAWDYNSVTAKNLILQGPGGNVGIGYSTPSYKLEISGHVMIRSSNRLYFDETYLNSIYASTNYLNINATSTLVFRINDSPYCSINNTNFDIDLKVLINTSLTFDNLQSVTITSNPQTVTPSYTRIELYTTRADTPGVYLQPGSLPNGTIIIVCLAYGSNNIRVVGGDQCGGYLLNREGTTTGRAGMLFIKNSSGLWYGLDKKGD